MTSDVATVETEAAALPQEWRQLRLGAVVQVKGGKRLPKGDGFALSVTPFPYIRIVDFFEGTVRTDELCYLKPDTQRSIRNYTISKYDVYISIAGTIGLVGVIPEVLDGANLTENAAKLVIRDRNVLDKDFLALYLISQSGKEQIDTLTAKTSQPKLALVRIEQIQLPLPPLAEQRAIALALRAAQAAAQARRRLAELERERKDALMQALFTKGTRGEVTKAMEIGEVPESWAVGGFDELVYITEGQVDPKVEPYCDMLHIGSENIEPDTGRLYKLQTNRDLGVISGNYYFTSDDVLYSKIRPYLNKVALPRFEGTCSADMYPLRPRNDRLNRVFLFYWLLSEQFKLRAMSFQDRTGIPKINRNQLKSIPLPVPPLAEQRAIAEALERCDEVIARLEREVALHEELFRALLEELMTGRVRAY